MALLYSFLGNIAMMLAVVTVYGFASKSLRSRKMTARIVSGLAFSIAVLITMQNKFVLTKGVVFDARSVVISVCGMFAGPMAVFIASITAIIHRVWNGGGGTFMGICVIISSALIGLLFRHLRKSRPQLTSTVNLYIFGLIVHLNMLFWALTLPREIIIDAYKTITLPVLLILPVGSLCFCKLLSNQEEQMKIADALKEKEELVEKMGEIAKIGAWEFDVKTRQNKWTSEVFRIHDLNPEQENNTEIGLGLYSRKSREKIETTMKEAIEFNKVYELEMEITTAKGITKWVRILGAPVFEDNEIIKVCGSFQDITERKRTEREVQKALETKSKFISVVSHELRTPLTAIKEGIALVADRVVGEINDEQKELLDISKRNVDRLARLINNVLDLQKLDSGIMKFNVEEGDINEVAKEVYETMAVSVKNTGLLFSLELDPDLPKCSFDNDRIIQVLTNLVTNAIKFTAKGSIAIKTGKTKDAVQVSVSDTGCGIRKEDLPEVFGRFEQLDHGGGRKTGGAGLGLAISREIVEWHKGKIWVESTCEKGAKFTFTLPLRQLKKNAENSPGQSITIA